MGTQASLRNGLTLESEVDDSADSFLRELAATPGLATGETYATSPFNPGETISDRFVVERLAGRGGMGTVYRALDRLSGEAVALKVMSHPDKDRDRFVQEARVLSKLLHPSIVRYVAHGATAQGQLFLAMQWLEGEDLAQRLSRSGLSVAESLAVARRLAAGLSAAHARGLVHRDVKPSNVFLVEGDPERATLLDFGIVHMGLSGLASSFRPRTETGTIVGTVGYMAPEQAIADRLLDARTDVFALGCVLFECLTGQAAFSGSHMAAVLAKVLREEPPRVRALRAGLPPALDDLTARLLSKDRAGRPGDGAAVLRELDALGDVAGGAPERVARESPSLSGGEQRLVSVLLARVPHDPLVSEVVRNHGGEPTRLADGTLLVTLGASSATSAPMLSAASCALQLHAKFPSATVALAIGRVNTADGSPSGQVIDRAASLLAEATTPTIRLDEVTIGLLESRFEVLESATGYVLVGRRAGLETPRTLLGKPTPCVGRDKELALLEATWRECRDESVARAVLVTGPAGQGKSRLRYEFIARGSVASSNANVLVARADPVGAGSSFLMARQLVRAAAGLREADPAAEQTSKLHAHLASRCNPTDAGRIAEFLGELIGVPSSERPGPELRAARNDPQIMAEWLRRSFGEWLAAECAAGPVLIVLEDLHWGDLPSATYLSEAMRALSTKSLMVLGLARPELHEALPNVLQGTERTEISLGRLTARAAERLMRAVLGDAPSAELVHRMVERAQGNAFFLEELIRCVEGGDEASLPETVFTLVQSRLERLDAEARRIARAASVFGESFWRGGVEELLGRAPTDLDSWFDRLAREEVICAAPSSRFLGEREYTFRHGLVRDVAYSMLTEEDRVTGHRLAAEWLLDAGEKDALTLADHLERGGQLARAVPWVVRAAHVANEGGDLEAAVALARRGLACGAEQMEAGLLRLIEGEALYGRGEMADSVGAYQTAMHLVPVGSTEWFQAAGSVVAAGALLADPAISRAAVRAILASPPPPQAHGPYAYALYHTCFGLSAMAQYEPGRALLQRATAVAHGSLDSDPAFGFWLNLARAWLDVFSDQPGFALASLVKAQEVAPCVATAHAQAVVGLIPVVVFANLGHARRALQAARDMQHLSRMTHFKEYADSWLAAVHIETGHASDAIPILRGLLHHRDTLLALIARAALAVALADHGELDEARRQADLALETGAAIPFVVLWALAALAKGELLRGNPTASLEHAERGLGMNTEILGSSKLRLVRAQALHALGRTDEARAAILASWKRILDVASTIEDSDLRDSWSTNVVANARTLTLVREWGP